MSTDINNDQSRSSTARTVASRSQSGVNSPPSTFDYWSARMAAPRYANSWATPRQKSLVIHSSNSSMNTVSYWKHLSIICCESLGVKLAPRVNKCLACLIVQCPPDHESVGFLDACTLPPTRTCLTPSICLTLVVTRVESQDDNDRASFDSKQSLGTAKNDWHFNRRSNTTYVLPFRFLH